MEEQELIKRSQTHAAQVKAILKAMGEDAEALAKINHKAGRFVQSGDAMVWHGAVLGCLADLIAAHGIASKALISGYENGGDIVAAGPIR